MVYASSRCQDNLEMYSRVQRTNIKKVLWFLLLVSIFSFFVLQEAPIEEHARELGNDGDIKEHVFPLSDNELHPEMHSIEEVQQQLQHQDQDQGEDTEADSAPSPAAAEENESSQHDSEADGEHELEAEGETEPENESPVAPVQASEPLILPSSTESPAAAIEERIKQIAQDFQKMASSQELQPKEELTPQSSLSLNDLIRTLRPNEQQIIPQIDSDYSNAMRVLGKPLGANN